MLWTYRVFCDNRGHYSIREVFYERDHTIICYSNPVAIIGASVEELMQLVQWFKEAFDLPILSLEEADAQIKARPIQPDEPTISLQALREELGL